MLQIDHVYEFFNIHLKNIDLHYFFRGVPDPLNYFVFKGNKDAPKILFYDQEPLLTNLSENYIKALRMYVYEKVDPKQTVQDMMQGKEFIPVDRTSAIVVSEKSKLSEDLCSLYDLKKMYYFYHGFAALDWYRGYHALNYNKSIVKQYNHDFISFNRIINNDRSYRIYFVSLLKEKELLKHGKVSFNVTDNLFDDWRDEVADPNTKLSLHARQHAEQNLTNINKLIIDSAELPGSASADIPRTVDALWNVVTETVFYYDKLHLTEKIFKPIVSKQPFMLLAAPGNLAYLKSYGFKTFDSVIDESYDSIQDNDARIEAVVNQLHWYCNLTPGEKTDIIRQLEPIIEYNFHHFYGEFRHVITRELLDNTKSLFQEIGHDDSHINYTNIYHVLTH